MNTSAPNTILTPAHLSLLIQGFNKDALLLIAGDTGEILASNRKGDELLATREWQGIQGKFWQVTVKVMNYLQHVNGRAKQ